MPKKLMDEDFEIMFKAFSRRKETNQEAWIRIFEYQDQLENNQNIEENDFNQIKSDINELKIILNEIKAILSIIFGDHFLVNGAWQQEHLVFNRKK